MNIFLDTTLTFSDPFFKKGYNHIFLKLAKQYKDIQFYMSDVVLQETIRHFKVNTDEQLHKIRQAENALGDYKPSFPASEKNWINHKVVEESRTLINQFEAFYKNLQEEGTLIILNSPGDLLAELIYRAVNRIRPFKEGKSEFRDAVTWLTYKDYIEKNQLIDCYFISNNVNDFFDNDKVKLHPDLIKDNIDIKPFVNFTKLKENDNKIKLYIEDKERRIEEIQEYIEANHINEEFVIDVLVENTNEISDLCNEYINTHFPPTEIPMDRFFRDFLHKVKIKNAHLAPSSLTNFKSEIIVEEIILSGVVSIMAAHHYLEINTGAIFTPRETVLFLPFSITLNPELDALTNIQYGDILHFHIGEPA
ncbi:PIN domain-containing protein (plasmid) [Niallia taxi]|uniref:PIN domain-containing protein n=1 Tax=Niallia taxi TaxID=2499688 RepID=UPI003F5E499C